MVDGIFISVSRRVQKSSYYTKTRKTLSEMVYWTNKNSKAGLLDFQRRPQENISLCKNLFSNAGKDLQFIYYIFKGLIAKQRRANYLGQATPALDACQGRYLQKPKLLLNEFKISFGSHD